MAEAVARRGPDDEGYAREEPFAAIHHRLSIIGPDTRGRQPMTIDGVTVVFNGCIYNYRELKRELEAGGVRFASDTDTEILPHLYRRHGTGMFARLNGMFAMVLWDVSTRELIAARDPFGEKPLYFCEQSGRLGLASSLAAFERGNWQLTPNLHAVADIIRGQAASAPVTMYREVWQMPPGCVLRRTSGEELERVRYFYLPAPSSLADDAGETVQFRLERQLDAAFLLRAVSDKPLGIFLSGGVDSSLVAESLARQLPGPIHTFSVRFSDGARDYDESTFAKRVAEHIGSVHQVLEVSAEAESSLHVLASAFDQPVANSTALPTYLICQAAKAHVDVALSGVGGDELFGGYPRYLGLRWHRRLRRIPAPIRAMAQGLLENLGESEGSRNLRGRLRRLLSGLDKPPEDAYREWISSGLESWPEIFSLPEPDRQETMFAGAVEDHGGVGALFSGYGVVGGAMAYDVLRYLPDDLLTLGDRMSMAHALELRAPFLDVGLLTMAMALETGLKVSGPPWREGLKLILKDIARKRLPADVVDRPKQGFTAPVKHWLRGPLAGLVEAMISRGPLCGLVRREFVTAVWRQHQTGRDRSETMWALLLLDLWMHERGWDFR